MISDNSTRTLRKYLHCFFQVNLKNYMYIGFKIDFDAEIPLTYQVQAVYRGSMAAHQRLMV